jgi:Zn-dependent protease
MPRRQSRWLTFRVSPSAVIGLAGLTFLILRTVDNPDRGTVAKAIGLSLILFATIVIHEFGHAGVALGMGLAPISITIHAMGGVTSYQRGRPSPGSDAAIAAAGPAATLVLAGIAAFLSARTTGSAHYLMNYWRDVSLVLTVFNLLPGLPLDGGAIVKAAVWAINRDERRATRFAAATGMVLALALVALGLYFRQKSDTFVGVGITLIVAIFIGLGAQRIWKETAPPDAVVRPNVLNARNEEPPDHLY